MVSHNGELYFAPGVRFADLDFNSQEAIIAAFEQRILGFYLKPADRLLGDEGGAFGSGLLCCATIDFLARYQSDGKGRFISWLMAHVPEFQADRALAGRFYGDFRNGLAHDGRVKNGGQFALGGSGQLICYDHGIITVDPRLLLERITEVFSEFCRRLRVDLAEFERFVCQLRLDFEKELRSVRHDRPSKSSRSWAT